MGEWSISRLNRCNIYLDGIYVGGFVDDRMTEKAVNLLNACTSIPKPEGIEELISLATRISTWQCTYTTQICAKEIIRTLKCPSCQAREALRLAGIEEK